MKWRLQFKQALAMLRDLCGSAAEFISTFKNSQMRRVWREAVRGRRPSWTELRQRAGITFWISTLGFVLFTAFIWSYDPIGGVYNKTLLNLVYTMVPLSTLLETKDARSSRRFAWWHFVFVLVNLAFLLIAISDRFDQPLLGLNVFLILMSAPFLLVFGGFIRRTPLLGVALVPSTITVEAFLAVTASSYGISLEYVLIPLPIVLMGSIIWTFVARFLLTHAHRRRQTIIWGPAMESASMLFMFLPLTLLAIVIPIVVTDDRTWLAVSVTIIGVSFGSVVSTPLRQFLLDLGQLPPIRRWEGDTDRQSHEESDL